MESMEEPHGSSAVLAVPVRPPDMTRLAKDLVASASERGIALTGEGGLLTALTKQVLQSALEAEMAHHLGYDKHGPAGRGSGNSRNATTSKTVTTEIGKVTVELPRDGAGTFEPQIVPKHQRRLSGFDEAVISLYAKGMTTGDIAAHLEKVYDTTISRDLVSTVTEKVTKEMREWQARPLDAVYPVIIVDAVYLKVREGTDANRPVYVVMGVNLEGYRDVLGLWLGPTGGEGAKHWLTVLTELKNRGILDACIVCCDGLKGLPEAVNTIWPEASVQTCVVLCGAPGAQQPATDLTQGLAEDHPRPAADLHRPDQGGRRGRVRRLRRTVAGPLSSHDGDLAQLVGGVRAVPPTRSSPSTPGSGPPLDAAAAFPTSNPRSRSST
jgi:hypothetical protein